MVVSAPVALQSLVPGPLLARLLPQLEGVEAIEVRKSGKLRAIEGLLPWLRIVRKRGQALQVLLPRSGRLRKVLQVIMADRGNQRDEAELGLVLQGYYWLQVKEIVFLN